MTLPHSLFGIPGQEIERPEITADASSNGFRKDAYVWLCYATYERRTWTKLNQIVRSSTSSSSTSCEVSTPSVEDEMMGENVTLMWGRGVSG